MLKFENKELLCIIKEMAGNSKAGDDSFDKRNMFQQSEEHLVVNG